MGILDTLATSMNLMEEEDQNQVSDDEATENDSQKKVPWITIFLYSHFAIKMQLILVFVFIQGDKTKPSTSTASKDGTKEKPKVSYSFC